MLACTTAAGGPPRQLGFHLMQFKSPIMFEGAHMLVTLADAIGKHYKKVHVYGHDNDLLYSSLCYHSLGD